MDSFVRNAILAIFAIVLVTIITMYMISPTGAYSWGRSVPQDGYCRCITGTYRSGITATPYGGQGLTYKGITTYSNCVNICNGQQSWISR